MHVTDFHFIGSKPTEILEQEIKELMDDRINAKFDSTMEVLRLEIIRRIEVIKSRKK